MACLTVRPLGCVFLALGILVLAGCGSNEPPTATVSGKVTYNGKPVSGGQVQFSSQGKTQMGVVAPDGGYIISGVLPGEASIAVIPPRIAPGMRGPAIPKKYENAESSGIKTKVAVGVQQYDIDLK